MQIIGRTIRHIAVEDTVLRAQGYHRVSAGNCLIIYRIDTAPTIIAICHRATEKKLPETVTVITSSRPLP